ncbi:uncharacterized protein [Heterodontus francisci]|uniref:uncharacterized protein n=1 Tax=Heterodontus francisci TaxID=7792 RepID=UPI00355B251E
MEKQNQETSNDQKERESERIWSVLEDPTMRTVCLFLLVLFWVPESVATELDSTVLADIIHRFRQVSGQQPSSTSGGGQFTFLMVLTPQQCTGANINQNVQFRPSDSGRPVIGGGVNYFLNRRSVNYIAVYPNTGSRCSENKLLHFTQEDQRYGQTDSAARLLQNSINNQGLQVGCVILYTTYTPCIQSCFSGNENCDILGPLGSAPFSTTWDNTNIHKYFVFSKLYPLDNNADKIPTVQGKLGQVTQARFHIRKCDGANNQIQCQDCSSPRYCI